MLRITAYHQKVQLKRRAHVDGVSMEGGPLENTGVKGIVNKFAFQLLWKSG